MDRLAIEGGQPVRVKVLSYGRQCIDEVDIEAVTEALRSEWLTTGPRVAEFERAFAGFVGAAEAVAVSSGTAALHAAMDALHIEPGDEVIVPAITFAATANCVLFRGGTPVFADVEPDTLLIDPQQLKTKITPQTKAVISVDYAGHPSSYDELRAIASRNGLQLVADACHALGGSYRGCPVGSLAALNTFSFHPVKAITAGEGGMVTTEDGNLAQRMRIFRNHGITTEHRQRDDEGTWFYEMTNLGYNYRLTDIQSALGIAQLKRLPDWIARRQAIARRYDAAFLTIDAVTPFRARPEVSHAYHLYVVRLDLTKLRVDRRTVFRALRAEGIGVSVHYIPVYLHPYYRERFGTGPGICPTAEAEYEKILSLPIWPRMSDGDVEDTIAAVRKVMDAYHK